MEKEKVQHCQKSSCSANKKLYGYFTSLCLDLLIFKLLAAKMHKDPLISPNNHQPLTTPTVFSWVFIANIFPQIHSSHPY